MAAVAVIWGLFALWSLWEGFHDGDWTTARWVWGVVGALGAWVGLQMWRERRSATKARQSAIDL